MPKTKNNYSSKRVELKFDYLNRKLWYVNGARVAGSSIDTKRRDAALKIAIPRTAGDTVKSQKNPIVRHGDGDNEADAPKRRNSVVPIDISHKNETETRPKRMKPGMVVRARRRSVRQAPPAVDPPRRRNPVVYPDVDTSSRT